MKRSFLPVLAAFLLSACSLPFAAAPTPTFVPTVALAQDTPELGIAALERSATASPAATTRTGSASLNRTPRPSRTATERPSTTITSGPSPTATPTATRTRFPSRTPTITPTPQPPQPELYIVRPGLLSKVISPIQMEIYADTGAGGNVMIDLVGEDGRVISRQLINRGDAAGRRFWLAPELPFEIEAAAETARLQLSTYDEAGRLSALSSVDLILLSVGRSEINPAVIEQQPYLIRRPDEDEVVRGGTLLLEALVRPVNESPLIVELVNDIGTVLAVQRYTVPPPTGALSHTPFTLEIPYTVRAETAVRLVLRQEGSRIPGSVALVSIPVILAP